MISTRARPDGGSFPLSPERLACLVLLICAYAAYTETKCNTTDTRNIQQSKREELILATTNGQKSQAADGELTRAPDAQQKDQFTP